MLDSAEENLEESPSEVNKVSNVDNTLRATRKSRRSLIHYEPLVTENVFRHSKVRDSKNFLIGTAPGRLYMTHETEQSITQMMANPTESNIDLNNLVTLEDSPEELSYKNCSVHSRNMSFDDAKLLTNISKESADVSAASSEEFEVTEKE